MCNVTSASFFSSSKPMLSTRPTTNASILTSGLLGEQYVGLEAGGDDKMLKNGDKIKMTQGAVVLEKLISQFLYNKASEGNDKTEKKAE